MNTFEKRKSLSPNQLGILKALLEGKTIKAIATQLGYSDSTIKRLLVNARNKLGAQTNIQAVGICVSIGLLAPAVDDYVREAQQKKAAHRTRKYASAKLDFLTPRQFEVYKLAKVEGLLNEELCEQLNITANTLRAHLREVYKKLQIKGQSSCKREALARWAKENDPVFISC